MEIIVDNPSKHGDHMHEWRLIESYDRNIRFFCKWCLTVVKVKT